MRTTKEPIQQPISFLQTAEFQKEFKTLKKKYTSIVDDLNSLLSLLEQTPHTAYHWAKTVSKFALPSKARIAGRVVVRELSHVSKS